MRLFRLAFTLGTLVGSMLACSSGAPEPAAQDPAHDPPVLPENGTCPSGRKLCDGLCVDVDDPAYGCSATACAPCGLPHAEAKCDRGACALAACDEGWANCNGFPSDGCEANVASDARNCGACGKVCPAQGTFAATCNAGACGLSCGPGTNFCGGACVADSPTACGASCTVCKAPANGAVTCAAGACGFVCNEGFGVCGAGCCSACGDTAGLQKDAAWPMIARCPTHTARAAVEGSATNVTKWTYGIGTKAALTPPAIGADGTLYFGAADGNLYALTASGTLKWTFGTGAYVGTMPAIGSDGTIYVGSNKLYAIAPSGTKLWEYAARVSGSPVIGADGTIYVGGDDGKLYAISKAGSLLWSFAVGTSVKAPALAPDGTIYAAGKDKLHAISKSGAPLFSFPTSGPKVQDVGTPTVAADGTVYVTMDFGWGSSGVYAIDGKGALKWGAPGSFATTTSIALAPDGSLVVNGSDKRLHAFKSDGTPKWSVSTPALVGAPTVDAAGNAFFAVSFDHVGATGSWYVVSSSGKVLVSGGGPLRNWHPPSIGSDGTVYVGGRDGVMYAFRK